MKVVSFLNQNQKYPVLSFYAFKVKKISPPIKSYSCFSSSWVIWYEDIRILFKHFVNMRYHMNLWQSIHILTIKSCLLQVSYFGDGLEAGQCGFTINRVDERNNGQIKCTLGISTEYTESIGTMHLIVGSKFFIVAIIFKIQIYLSK